MKLFRLFELEDRIDRLEEILIKIDEDTYQLIKKHKHDSHNWLYKNGDEFTILGKEYLLVDTYLSGGTQEKFIYHVYDKDEKYTKTWTEHELREWMVCDKINENI